MSNADKSSDLFELYFDLLADTENPIAFHRWTLISCISSLLGRNIYLPFGVDQLYPNMFICLIGPSASRKSHSISVGRKILTAAQFKKFACSKTSKEKFIDIVNIGLEKDFSHTLDFETLKHQIIKAYLK